MAIVDFSKIAQVMPGNAQAISGGGPAMGVTTIGGRPTLYDPLWGYYIFGQSVACEYRDDNAYRDIATFSIQGTFTRSAEMGQENITDAQYVAADEAGFRAVVAKYDALETVCSAAGQSVAPDSYSAWGTAADKRCMALPAPLLDKSGNVIFGIPVSLRIKKTQFPLCIEYEAVLREAKFPLAKLILNGIIIDGGVVNITVPQPEFARHQLVGTSGEVLQLKHYKTMEVDVSGSLPLMAGEPISQQMKSLAASLEGGKLSLAVAVNWNGNPETTRLWDALVVVDDPSVEADYSTETMSVSVRARE